MFVILNVLSLLLSDTTQFLVLFISRWILQLIKSIAKDLQKLLKYFSETTSFAFFHAPSLAGFPKITDLYLNDVEFVVVT